LIQVATGCGGRFDLSADGVFGLTDDTALAADSEKIDRSVSIVAETEQLPNRRNSPLNSTAQMSDGPGKRFFVMRGKNLVR
jgi:hypothetical protein